MVLVPVALVFVLVLVVVSHAVAEPPTPDEIGGWRMALRPRTSIDTMILAVIGGLIGFLATVIGGYLAWRDPLYLRGLETLGILGAGIGWLFGATIGLILTGATPPHGGAEAWTLRATAAIFVVAGLTTSWWTLVLPGTQGLGYHVTARNPMQWSIWFDAALAALTCLVLAQRMFRRQAIVIGAIAAVGVVASAIVLVASGPCPLSHCDDLLAG